ncbi:phosphotransferase [Paenibacillus sp. GbtcB18]|uniref:phosphotransferase n=1 Tax=Paenibacillus sp. GbtcB18 TaxID=2824763 RepID=UPI001C2F7E50|nr:phosphotransferase [Paenibacillus sp. GbtcB18]
MLKLMAFAETITPAWLRENLLESTHFHAIRALTKSVIYKSPVTVIFRLLLEYDEGERNNRPDSLLLKIKKANEDTEVGQKEVTFYNYLLPLLEGISTVKCYYAGFVEKKALSCIIMEDLTQTHSSPEFALPPPFIQCEEAMRSLARFHGSCWDHGAVLEQVVERAGRFTHRNFMTTRFAETEELVERFLFFMGDRLADQRRSLYTKLVQSGGRLLAERLNRSKHLTLVHGDAHLWNFLYANEASNDGNRAAIVLDWEYWDVGVGPTETAYAVALWMFPEQRKAVENKLMLTYHNELVSSGVSGYSWNQCRHDYRIGLLQNLLYPVWHWHNGERAELWWNHLERALLAAQDSGCEELL